MYNYFFIFVKNKQIMQNIKNFVGNVGLAVAVIFSFLLLNSSIKPEQNLEIPKESNKLPQVVKPPKLSSELYFAGEKIPFNVDTRERLDREFLVNTYYHSSSVIAMKNAARYFPIIEDILKEEGVPLDFKYLSVAESNLSNVISSAGARGFWQFMKAASKDYGLEVNKEVDERYHLEKSTRAAAKYLKWLKDKHGSWINAAAAYNMGPGGFSRAQKSQGEDSFFDLNLNSETSRYVFRLVAIKEIMSNPEKFGFYLDPDDKYEPWNTYQVKVNQSVTDLGAFARSHGSSYRILKYYNPWLIDNKLTVVKNTYYIRFPR
jgi:hypothetical protein